MLSVEKLKNVTKSLVFSLLLCSLALFPLKIYGVSIFYWASAGLFIVAIKYLGNSLIASRPSQLVLCITAVCFVRFVYAVFDSQSDGPSLQVIFGGLYSLIFIVAFTGYFNRKDFSLHFPPLVGWTLVSIFGALLVVSYEGVRALSFDQVASAFSVYFSASSDSDFEARFLLRNTVAEVFALFVAVIFVSAPRTKIRFLYYALAVMVVLVTGSRKGFLLSLIPIFYYLFNRNLFLTKRLLLVVSICILIPALFFLFGGNEVDFRQIDFSDPKRLAMITFVGEQGVSLLLFGNGLGALHYGQNIHNLLINELFKTGVVGFIAVLSLYIVFLKDFLVSWVKHEKRCVFLVFPLVSMMVSSVYELIFTPGSLVAISVFYALNKYQEKDK